ncbi:MAG: ABC transporter substrate-binding protein [Betaproteobacteria bacterium]|nr:ABC transporter substrate-binding protein [Betaproteobacteria bacterium]
MDRRTFVTIVAGTCLLPSLAVRAQQDGKPVRIGLLAPATEPGAGSRIDLAALRTGLRELGWVEGKNLSIEIRWAGENSRRQRELAADLRALPVVLILAFGTSTIRAAHDGAPGLPIVMVNAGDPVGAGFVASLARPGGDLTGTSAAGEEVLAKQLELLAAAVPKVRRVSVLMNSANPANGFFFDAMSLRANTLGLQLERIDVEAEGDLDKAMARAKGGALVVVGDPMFLRRRASITALAVRHQVPSVFGGREYVAAGGLMSFLSSNAWHWRTAAGFVDKIIKGAKPADIPVEQPTRFELVINARTAKALGISMPQALLARADEVIQ